MQRAGVGDNKLCELLLHRNGRGDPRDKSDWQPLDVVIVKNDGHIWGSREVGANSSFILVKMPGVPAIEMQDMLEPTMALRRRVIDSDPITDAPIFADIPTATDLRSKSFDPAKIPVRLENAITRNVDGTVTVAKVDITLTAQESQELITAKRLKVAPIRVTRA